MIRFKYGGALLSFAAVLIVFFTVQDVLVTLQQRNSLMTMVRSHAERELSLMADASYEAILKHDYATIRSFANRWGETHREYKAIRALAPNGFVLAEFKRQASPEVPLFSLSKSVTDGSRELMVLELVGDYSEAMKVVVLLRNRLVLGSIVFSALLGAALWLTLRRTALRPMEVELALQKRVEEDLETKVAERTGELKQELAERERIEHELREREEHIRLLLNSTAEAIYGVDIHGLCTFCNPACLAMLGYEKEQDLVGKNPHELMHHSRADGSRCPEAECRIYHAFRNNHGCHVDDEVFWRADGTSLNVEYWSYPIVRGQEVTGAVVTFIDITGRRNLESQILHAQKMEAVGTLAGGVAHDFNNILTAIIGYGSMLRKKMAEGPLVENVDHMLDAAQRAAQLTKSLLAFSRKQELIFRQVDVNEVIPRTAKLIARLIREDIAFETVLTGSELNVLADIAQIEQVLMNLATNARDAMPAGGRFSIRTERVALQAEYAVMHRYVEPGEYALISVSDSGTGIDEKTRQKIFEPFFTTKEAGSGTGLGLSMAYGIIKQHKGYINVYSEVGKGTVFKIYLPLVKSAVRAVDLAEAEKVIPRGSETILIAEDDRSIRQLAKSLLEEHGYRVIEAEDGTDAVRKIRGNPGQVGLLMLDIIMPRMSGRAAYDEILNIQPGIKVLFMSGYTSDLVSIKNILDEGLDFIQKPMSPFNLLTKVRTILDR